MTPLVWAGTLAMMTLLGTLSEAIASSGNPVQSLPWNDPKEILEYHSCGCADACWVAELKSRSTGKIKVRLRCDCERLKVSYGDPRKETLRAPDCKRFEESGKLDLITEEIRSLLKEAKTASLEPKMKEDQAAKIFLEAIQKGTFPGLKPDETEYARKLLASGPGAKGILPGKRKEKCKAVFARVLSVRPELSSLPELKSLDSTEDCWVFELEGGLRSGAGGCIRIRDRKPLFGWILPEG